MTTNFEIISQMNTDDGLEMTISLNGKIMKKVWSYEHLNAFLKKEEEEKEKKQIHTKKQNDRNIEYRNNNNNTYDDDKITKQAKYE